MNKLKIGLLVFVLMVVCFSPMAASASGAWEITGSMAVPRQLHTATLLLDGHVLVTGGVSVGNTPTATVEIYDPASGTWSPANSMSTARSRHTATLLQDGRVLVAGGRGLSGSSLRSAELYDPVTGNWTLVTPMTFARAFATATLLQDGRVLVTGGLSDDFLYGPANNSVEIYDPDTGIWTVVDHMANARYGHRAILLANGTVLIAGGAGQEGDCIYKVTGEIYNPNTNRWSNTVPMTTPRGFYPAVLIPDGRVLMAGGFTLPATCDQVTASAEVYDSGNGKWSSVGNLLTARGALAEAAVLADGNVLVAGGRSNNGATATAELFNSATNTWASAGSMHDARTGHTTTTLNDGRVLVVGGGAQGIYHASAELYVP